MPSKPILIAVASQTAPAAAVAAPDLLALPWVSIAIGLLIASVGGWVGTLRRASKVAVTGRVIATDQVFALAAGFIAFGYAAWHQWGAIETAVLCLVAGFAGQAILDVAVSVITRRGEKLGGSD